MCSELAEHFEQRLPRTKLEHLVNHRLHHLLHFFFAAIHCWRHRAATLVDCFTILVISYLTILSFFLSFVQFIMFGVGVPRTNAFHLEEAKKKEDNSRGSAICNYATFWEILFSPYRRFLPRYLLWVLNIIGGHSAPINSIAHGNYRSRGAWLQYMCLAASASPLRRWSLFYWDSRFVYLFYFSLVGWFDFHLLGGLFISQFDIEIGSQTHEVGGPWRVKDRWKIGQAHSPITRVEADTNNYCIVNFKKKYSMWNW